MEWIVEKYKDGSIVGTENNEGKKIYTNVSGIDRAHVTQKVTSGNGESDSKSIEVIPLGLGPGDEINVRFMDGTREISRFVLDMNRSVLFGNTLVDLPSDPSKNGYRFTGWYTDPACTQRFSPLVPVLSDTVVYAGWESTGSSGSIEVSGYIVTFNVADGLEYEVTGTGANAVSFTVSVKNGYRFTGWYTDPACTQRFSPLVPVLSDTVVYAGWESTGSSGSIEVSGYIVTFNVADGLEYEVTGTGANAVSFTVSVKNGYRFDTGSITASVGVGKITPVNGVYTLAGISKDTVIDITGDRLYAVSYDLKNVSLSSEDLGRDSLKASFSPAFGWSGMDIRVIMGGADVTSEYVDGSAVSIPELKGDVIIIAQADMPWIYIAIGAIVIIAILAGALLIRRRGA